MREMDWGICGPPVDVATFGRFEVVEELVYYDGPRIFTAKCALGYVLWFLADYDEKMLRYIVVPTDPDTMEKLKNCSMPLLQALDHPVVWFFDVDHDENPVAAWKGTLADVPSDMLPDEDFDL